jgi:hypothetical protein
VFIRRNLKLCSMRNDPTHRDSIGLAGYYRIEANQELAERTHNWLARYGLEYLRISGTEGVESPMAHSVVEESIPRTSSTLISS